jgi:hypothetical protein
MYEYFSFIYNVRIRSPACPNPHFNEDIGSMPGESKAKRLSTCPEASSQFLFPVALPDHSAS